MEKQRIHVVLEGLSDIMFDRFIDHSKEQRPPEQKLYLYGDNELVIPAENIYGFLFGENPMGAVCRFEGKKKKDYLAVGQSHVFVDPVIVPFVDKKNKPVNFKGFDSGEFWVYESAPRTKQGSLSIKQEIKKRPCLRLPWEIEFNITLLKNDLIDAVKLENWFVNGGMIIGLGTHRPRFGRFAVAEWDVSKG